MGICDPLIVVTVLHQKFAETWAAVCFLRAVFLPCLFSYLQGLIQEFCNVFDCDLVFYVQYFHGVFQCCYAVWASYSYSVYS